jgi:hypothetical protein
MGVIKNHSFRKLGNLYAVSSEYNQILPSFTVRSITASKNTMQIHEA